ncbi:MAG: PqqD family protein [Clostridia bacterium]|nr:PqqD family protein [Clostridia bacterium]
MKLKDVIITEANGEYVAVTADGSFNGMIRMNKTAAFIAEALSEETTVEAITARLCEKYEVTPEIAEDNVRKVIAQFERAGLIAK